MNSEGFICVCLFIYLCRTIIIKEKRDYKFDGEQEQNGRGWGRIGERGNDSIVF